VGQQRPLVTLAEEHEHAPALQFGEGLLHVLTVVSVTRSGPHCVTVVAFAHTSCPGVADVQSESMGRQVPALMPLCESHSCPAVHVPLADHEPPLQMSVTFCSLPLHASCPGVEHEQPSTPRTPVPVGAQGL
jgi:hypothetical protein